MGNPQREAESGRDLAPWQQGAGRPSCFCLSASPHPSRGWVCKLFQGLFVCGCFPFSHLCAASLGCSQSKQAVGWTQRPANDRGCLLPQGGRPLCPGEVKSLRAPRGSALPVGTAPGALLAPAGHLEMGPSPLLRKLCSYSGFQRRSQSGGGRGRTEEEHGSLPRQAAMEPGAGLAYP